MRESCTVNKRNSIEDLLGQSKYLWRLEQYRPCMRGLRDDRTKRRTKQLQHDALVDSVGALVVKRIVELDNMERRTTVLNFAQTLQILHFSSRGVCSHDFQRNPFLTPGLKQKQNEK